jgi:hypothetical protein
LYEKEKILQIYLEDKLLKTTITQTIHFEDSDCNVYDNLDDLINDNDSGTIPDLIHNECSNVNKLVHEDTIEDTKLSSVLNKPTITEASLLYSEIDFKITKEKELENVIAAQSEEMKVIESVCC